MFSFSALQRKISSCLKSSIVFPFHQFFIKDQLRSGISVARPPRCTNFDKKCFLSYVSPQGAIWKSYDCSHANMSECRKSWCLLNGSLVWLHAQNSSKFHQIFNHDTSAACYGIKKLFESFCLLCHLKWDNALLRRRHENELLKRIRRHLRNEEKPPATSTRKSSTCHQINLIVANKFFFSTPSHCLGLNLN